MTFLYTVFNSVSAFLKSLRAWAFISCCDCACAGKDSSRAYAPRRVRIESFMDRILGLADRMSTGRTVTGVLEVENADKFPEWQGTACC